MKCITKALILCLLSLQIFEQKAYATKDTELIATCVTFAGLGVATIGLTARYISNSKLAKNIVDFNERTLDLEKKLQNYKEQHTVDAQFLYSYRQDIRNCFDQCEILKKEMQKRYSWEKIWGLGLGDCVLTLDNMYKKAMSLNILCYKEIKNIEELQLKQQKEIWIKKLQETKVFWEQELDYLCLLKPISIDIITPDVFNNLTEHSLCLAKIKIKNIFNDISAFNDFMRNHFPGEDIACEHQDILKKSKQLLSRITTLEDICVEIKAYEKETIFYSDILKLSMTKGLVDESYIVQISRLLCSNDTYPLSGMISCLGLSISALQKIKHNYGYVAYVSSGQTLYENYADGSAVSKVIAILEKIRNIILSSNHFCQEKQIKYQHELERKKARAEEERAMAEKDRLNVEKRKLKEQIKHAQNLEELEKEKIEVEKKKIKLEQDKLKLENEKLKQQNKKLEQEKKQLELQIKKNNNDNDKIF